MRKENVPGQPAPPVKNRRTPEKQPGDAGQPGGRWLIGIAAGVFSCLIMSLVIVWCNIERMDMTYFMNARQLDVKEREALLAKLEIEKEHLLSPYVLGNKAKELGMHPPRPEQIRRLQGS